MKMTLERAQEYGWGDRAAAFASWWNRTNSVCFRLSGLTLDDLADYDFAGAFSSGETPEDTARAVLEAEGWDEDMVE